MNNDLKNFNKTCLLAGDDDPRSL